ncbi:MAG: hypothetical protein NZM35_06685 [Chitinophagales bacterium]|nr:hypothetical protein [Chitinophagales bacterium]MDW8419377.1 hypothetical protein [Chitinophagales bacterium]
MEFKVIIYIIIGILYLLYSVGKKAQENKNRRAPKSTGKPSTPPTASPSPNPLDEILRELERAKTESAKSTSGAGKTITPTATQQPKKPDKPTRSVRGTLQKSKDILLHEKPVEVFEEGVTNTFSQYERELTEEEKIERGTLRIKNEGAYKIETLEEMDTREKAVSSEPFSFDIRNAIISSVILERKF